MLDSISRIIVNVIYLVPQQLDRFRAKFPDEQIVAFGMAKARSTTVESEPQYELGWILARRRVLILTGSALHCGNWVIPLESIRQATLLKISGGALLKVSTVDGLYYQFGLQYDPAWEEQTVLPLKVEVGGLKLSPASLIFRFVIVVWLLWSLVEDFAQPEPNLFLALLKALLLLLILPPLLGALKTIRA